MDKLKDTLEDLSITNDEIKKLSDAFKDEEFRKLFREYAEELQDPENRRKYEEELTAMENERGMDVEFINPSAGHTLKAIQNGEKKIFVNLCCSEKIEPAKIVSSNKNGVKGAQWSIPHSFSPPREDIDKKKDTCLVYDVVFNPDTYKRGVNDTRFRQMLHDTALQGIENSFHVQIDKTNVRVLKMKMKGQPSATVIRRKRDDYVEKQKDLQVREDGPLKFPYPNEANETHKMTYDVKKPNEKLTEYTQPMYTIKYSDEFDVANYVGEHVQHRSRPKKLIVEIKLPLVASANSVDLDIDNTHFTLSTDKPFKYKLELKFTYPILSEKGTAKFDKTTRILKLDLPIEQLPEVRADIMDDTFSLGDETEQPKSSLIDDSFPLIENNDSAINGSDSLEENEPCKKEDRETEASAKEDEIERKIPNIVLRCRTTDLFAIVLCDIKNVNTDDIEVLSHLSDTVCQNVTLNFSTCGQGGWKTCYSLPLLLTLTGPINVDQTHVTYRVSKENITIKVPINVGSEQIISVRFCDQIISLERKENYFSWKNIDITTKCIDGEDVDDNTFNLAYGNVNENVFKIVCVSLDQEINFEKEFPVAIVPVIAEQAINGEEDITIQEDVQHSECVQNEEYIVDEIEENPNVQDHGESQETIETLIVADNCVNGDIENCVEEIAPVVDQTIVTHEVEEHKEIEGIVPSDYFEERRDPRHRTYCAVGLDETLLFELD